MNWKVRIKNPAWWVTVIPAVLLVVQCVAAVFGVRLELGDLQNDLLALVDAIFAVLVAVGVNIDPTTAGVADSERAMGYTEPWDDLRAGGAQ